MHGHSDSDDEKDEDDDVNVEKQIKIVVLGETNVGKSSFIKRFCHDEFSRYYNQTVGADFYLKRLYLPGNYDVNVRISDISAFEFKGPMFENYLFNVDIIILMYDITNKSSFESLPIWLDEIRKILSEERTKITIVGNKCDVEHHRNVKQLDVRTFATTHELKNYMVSSKTAEGVNACIMELVAEHFGVVLTKQDNNLVPIKAEIMPPSARIPIKTEVKTLTQNSTICILQ